MFENYFSLDSIIFEHEIYLRAAMRAGFSEHRLFVFTADAWLRFTRVKTAVLNFPMTTGRVLEIFRNGRKHETNIRLQLPSGAKGNYLTMQVMAALVRADAQEKDFKNFVMREIIGLDKRTLSEKVQAAYRFCQREIKYLPERDGYETLADFWSCLYKLDPTGAEARGDCAIKSIALATCLRFFDLNPIFSAIRQVPNVDWFNHVFVRCEIDGVLTTLDPTPDDFQIGDELESLQRVDLKIFK